MRTQDNCGTRMFHIQGKPLSGGLARGQAFIYSDVLETRQESRSLEAHQVEAEWRRLGEAKASVRSLLVESAERIRRALNQELADIFLAQVAMLADPQLDEDLERTLREKRLNAERVVELVFLEWSRTFRAAPSVMLSQRADDVDDLHRRLVGVLAGVHAHRLESLPEGSILVARRLLPSDTIFLSGRSCAAILLVEAGATAHATILARELGIPCVGGLPNLLMCIRTGDGILVDGRTGSVDVNPGREAVAAFEADLARFAERAAEGRSKRFDAAVTGRGRQVTVMANVSSREDVERAVESGADGIGLFRTEGFFLAARTLPSTEEYAAWLGHCLEPLEGKPVNLRLLDIGGDKNAPYLSLPPELNPFLGRRGIRVLFHFPILLDTQLEAMLLVSRTRDVRILAPMITFAEEMERLRARAAAIADRLGIPLPPLGAMIETPAAALSVPGLRRHSDFFCAGTNDLTQYVMAADRESALVAEYFRDDHPVILGLLRKLVEESAGAPVTLCGELAARPECLPQVLDTGLRTLSVAAARIPDLKEAIRASTRNAKP